MPKELQQLEKSSKSVAAYLRAVTSVDYLTGMGNKRVFHSDLGRQFDGSKRYRLSFALMLADFDRFKQVNDTYGHIFGDFALRYASQGLIAPHLRSADAAYRIGGDEFAFILPSATLVSAKIIAEKLNRAARDADVAGYLEHTRDAHKMDGKDCTVFENLLNAIAGKEKPGITFSIGISSYPSPTNEPIRDHSELQKGADEALYAAKKRGRNRVCTVLDLENNRK